MSVQIPTMFTKIILMPDKDVTNLLGATVSLEIDQAFRIGHSIAVLFEGNVLGHLEKRSARVVWRHLQSDPTAAIKAEIYRNVGEWNNERWFSIMNHAFEIGVKIDFHEKSQEDARLLMAHITRKKLHCFAGLEVDNCPKDLLSMVRPFEDENGVPSLYFV